MLISLNVDLPDTTESNDETLVNDWLQTFGHRIAEQLYSAKVPAKVTLSDEYETLAVFN